MRASTRRAGCRVVCVLACLRCTTYVVSTTPRTLISSRPVHVETHLEVTTEPTEVKPSATFKSMKVTEFEDHFRETTVIQHYPSLLGELAFAAGISAALLLAVDMNNKGFAQYATATKYTAGAIFGVGCLAELVGRTVNWTKASNGTEMRTKIEPVPLKVLDHDHVVANLSPDEAGMAAFDLREHLSSLGEPPRDLTLTVRMEDTDSASRSLSVSRHVFASAVEQHRAEVERQERDAREQRLAQERAEREERERKAQAAAAVAAALDNVVRSMDQWDRAQFTTALMYADAGFQYYVVDKCSALGIKTYGDFLNLPLRSQIDIVRQLAHMAGGEGYGASMILQSLLKIPAYLAEEVLR